MAGNVYCQILDSNGQKQSILNYKGFFYHVQLNGNGYFNINVGAASAYSHSIYLPYELVNDSGNEQGIVYFYKGTVLEFKGFVTKLDYNSKGEMILSGTGTGGFLVKEYVTDGSRNAEDADTVRLAYIMNNSTKIDETGTLTAGNVEAKNFHQSNIFDAMYDLVVLRMGNEFRYSFDGTIGNNDDLVVSSRIGSSTSRKTFIIGIDFKSTSYSVDVDNIINSVTVEGRYDGDNDVYFTGSDTDATSITKYGTRKPKQPVIDRSCRSNAECTAKAGVIIDNYKNPTEKIVMNGIFNKDGIVFDNSNWGVGDRLVVHDPASNLNNADMRIVGFTRGMDETRNESLNVNIIKEGYKYISKNDESIKNVSQRDGGALEDMDVLGTANAGGAATSKYVDSQAYGVYNITSGNSQNSSTFTPNITTSFLIVTFCWDIKFTAGANNNINLGIYNNATSALVSQYVQLNVYGQSHTHNTDVSLTIPSHSHTVNSHSHSNNTPAHPYFVVTDSGGGTGYVGDIVTGSANPGTSTDPGGTPGGTFTSGNPNVVTRSYTTTFICGGNFNGTALYLRVENSNIASLNIRGVYTIYGMGYHTHSITGYADPFKKGTGD